MIKTSPVNLLTYSEQFDQSAWAKENVSLTPNASTAPDGTTTAEEVLATGSGRHRVSQLVSGSVGYVFSIFVKSNGTSHISIKCSGGNIATEFDIVNGTIARSAPNGGLTNPFITPLANEWYRIGGTVPTSNNWLIGTSDGTSSYSSTADISYTAQPGDAYYIWGAQLEEGTTATDYIPTGATISGAPRFDHDPVTGESLGLLIEESRTNLAKYSEPDDRSANGGPGEWYFSDLDPNTEITKVEGPDGVSNSASEMQLATGNGIDAALTQIPVTSGASYTFSAWVKLGTATNLALHVNNTTAWDSVPDGTYSFDVNDGLNTNTFVKVSHTFTAPSTGSVNVHIGRHKGTVPVQ